MQNQANANEGALINRPMANPSMNMQPVNAAYPPQVMPMMVNQMVYPEIFYKLQPYILLACDQMDTFSPLMPTQEMVDQMTDGIYDDVCRMHPDIAEYARDYDRKAKDDPPDPPMGFGRGFGMFGRGPFGLGFRRRGLLPDLITILLLSELSRRRRRF
ncbi:hypothetical protein [Caproiciproducens sp.]|uniref:hypothetical protein n=1 Tax=Caproiciproducens sp. TaxID=1954376 RepID=UPI00289C281F|nr:hypothetical protein [Caproiciproducens sp.]